LGTSEWRAAQITGAIEICEKLNLHRPVVERPQYNMIHREKIEVEYGYIFDKYGYGSTVWSRLAAGLLTGKYLKEVNEGRFSLAPEAWKGLYHWNDYFNEEKLPKTKKMFEGLEEVAKELGGTVPQLALAWVLRNKDVSTCMCGFSRVSQVEDNVKAIEVLRKFTGQIREWTLRMGSCWRLEDKRERWSFLCEIRLESKCGGVEELFVL